MYAVSSLVFNSLYREFSSFLTKVWDIELVISFLDYLYFAKRKRRSRNVIPMIIL